MLRGRPLLLVALVSAASSCRSDPPSGPDPRSPEAITQAIGEKHDDHAAAPQAATEPPPKANLRNRLGESQSPYLRSAAEQPVAWQEWGSEAFDLATKLNRPILLDVGAVWCHWCHVIDRESYEDPEIARLINDRFVPVKVDRDERPDVDRRYQTLVTAIGNSGGGWPLTAFLTPDGRVITGGTYFPPTDRDGRPGMKTILPRIADLWRDEPDDVSQRAQVLLEHVQRNEKDSLKPGELDPKLLDGLDDAIRSAYDSQHGGFGAPDGPKFPQGSVLVYTLLRSQITGDSEMKQMALRTVREMARGGVRDQLGGAFHRYSTDGAWVLPHFEVMSYVNAELILAAAEAYRATGDEEFRRIAEEAIGYVDRVGSDREHGGFFACQDADVGPDDDGGYWTWTRAEVDAVTTPDEARALCLSYDVGDEGEMAKTAHGSPDRNVLHVARSDEDVAATLEKSVADVRALLASGRKKLFDARTQRVAPLVDRNLVASWNGLMIVAYFEAADAFRTDAPRAFALLSLDRILECAYRKGLGVMHTILDGEARVPGVLDDQVQIALACVRAYEATGRARYLEVAEHLARLLIDRYRDLERGGFFDRPTDATGPAVLSTRTRPVDDSPTPSGNGAAALLLGKLYAITDKSIYRERQEETLKAFAGTVKDWGLFVATYATALQFHVRVPPRVLVIGKRSDSATQALAAEARRAFRPGKIVLVLDPSDGPKLPYPADEKGRPLAYVCSGHTCGPPTNDADTLRHLIED